MTFDEAKHARERDGKFTSKPHPEADTVTLETSTPTTRSDGTVEWRNPQGELHRAGDQPAITYPDGTQEWWQHGQHHRAGDQPATISPDGSMSWHKHGQTHRDADQPATVDADGSRYWYKHGKLHREGGPAVVMADGETLWYSEGQLIDPPATD